mmetsp:Transcript_7457/g.21830  ORF Transcript_7457/g.21830 Transcript_7457/m.21830 type:complete len:254 (+) Transcript_7457:364-1125(+)
MRVRHHRFHSCGVLGRRGIVFRLLADGQGLRIEFLIGREAVQVVAGAWRDVVDVFGLHQEGVAPPCLAVRTVLLLRLLASGGLLLVFLLVLLDDALVLLAALVALELRGDAEAAVDAGDVLRAVDAQADAPLAVLLLQHCVDAAAEHAVVAVAGLAVDAVLQAAVAQVVLLRQPLAHLVEREADPRVHALVVVLEEPHVLEVLHVQLCARRHRVHLRLVGVEAHHPAAGRLLAGGGGGVVWVGKCHGWCCLNE